MAVLTSFVLLVGAVLGALARWALQRLLGANPSRRALWSCETAAAAALGLLAGSALGGGGSAAARAMAMGLAAALTAYAGSAFALAVAAVPDAAGSRPFLSAAGHMASALVISLAAAAIMIYGRFAR